MDVEEAAAARGGAAAECGHPSGPPLRRSAKDGVFRSLFSDRRYVLELYRSLHPEDGETAEGDLEIVTLERVVTSGPYNDLGFVAGGRLVVLVEAQSTWSPNIATRMLLYLAETYKEVLRGSRTALYGSRLVPLPAPELYVVYTGRAEVPGEVRFARDVLRDDSARLDFSVDVLTGGEGIVGEYVGFARCYDEVAAGPADPGRKAKTVVDTCISRGILVGYLKSHYEEVVDIMFTLFDQDEQYRLYEAELREDMRAEGRAEGLAEGRAEGLTDGVAASARSLMAKMGMPADEAMDLLGVPSDMRERVGALLTA